jgi:DNA-binding MarR family transcriptional regulator
MKKTIQANDETSRELTQRLLGLSDRIYRSLEPGIPHEGVSRWLSSDITVSQLRVLLLLHTEGPMKMSAIAAHLGIALSTATGFVDKLVEKEMVKRAEDPADRRSVVCSLSEAGGRLISGLWDVGRQQIERLVAGLSEEQLKQAVRVAEFLYENVTAGDKNAPAKRVKHVR